MLNTHIVLAIFRQSLNYGSQMESKGESNVENYDSSDGYPVIWTLPFLDPGLIGNNWTRWFESSKVYSRLGAVEGHLPFSAEESLHHQVATAKTWIILPRVQYLRLPLGYTDDSSSAFNSIGDKVDLMDVSRMTRCFDPRKRMFRFYRVKHVYEKVTIAANRRLKSLKNTVLHRGRMRTTSCTGGIRFAFLQI